MLSPNEGYGDPGIWNTIPGYGKKKSRGSFGQNNFWGLMYYEQLFLTAVDLITFSVQFYSIIVHWLSIKIKWSSSFKLAFNR